VRGWLGDGWPQPGPYGSCGCCPAYPSDRWART
jgi:hypothetical protein